MNTIEILIEGYAQIKEKGWEASGTTCLISTDSGMKIITDPGANRDLLLERLSGKGLTVGDIQMVFLTHHHLDHAMSVGIFPNAKVVDAEAIYTQDKAEEGVAMLPDTDITILPTPGHEAGHGILVVPTSQGTVVVAGDNFWWTADEEQVLDLEKKDDFAEDMSVLIESRKKVLELADWVVPGHGKVFEVKK
ncbi:MAG TPA: MBL fold metallo-hydrolase [Candidatus Saccharimonadales bacterium]|nr:MBL fold metallo-hydrolase [Candidatus Saccharimonadales bacterium]